MSEQIRIGLVGFGNIGVGVVKNLHANQNLIDERLVCPMRIARIADKDQETRRDVGFDYTDMLTDDASAVLEADDIDIVIELVGGYEPARSFIERALQSGKHVVTANKAVISKFGPDLMRLADEKGVSLLLEASVGGGIPIIRALNGGLAPNRLTGVFGILNGTCNYILTQMSENGVAFKDALADAQEKGYAEPDPTFDIEGIDTAHKTAILAWLAFGRPTLGDEVYVEGLTEIIPADLEFAADNDYVVKMLGIARQTTSGALELRAHPTYVPASSMLAAVNDVYNAVMVNGRPIGPTLYFGQGAGPDATSSAILSDCMALADAMAEGGAGRESRLLRPKSDLALQSMGAIVSAFYLRGKYGPHHARKIIDRLESRDIEITQLHAPDNGPVQILTALTREETLRSALRPLRDIQPYVMRVLSE